MIIKNLYGQVEVLMEIMNGIFVEVILIEKCT